MRRQTIAGGRWRTVVLGLVMTGMPITTLAQTGKEIPDSPPMPVDELAAEFARDPGSSVRLLPGSCPERGTWRHDLLLLLLEHPTNSRQADALINAQSLNVEQCNIAELDLWFRRALADPPSAWSVRPITRSLWHSGREDNRNAVLTALFDPEFDVSLREGMADELVGIPPLGVGPEAALRVFADGYRRTGTAPPLTAAMTALRRAGGDHGALPAKRSLIGAWRSNPSAPGSLALLSLLWNDAIADMDREGRRPTGWSRAVEALMVQVVSGELDVSEEVLQYAIDRLPMLRGWN